MASQLKLNDLQDRASKQYTRACLKKALATGLIPQWLRAIESCNGRKLHHFVEWHTGSAGELWKARSHAQLCLYSDLCENQHFSDTVASKQTAFANLQDGSLANDSSKAAKFEYGFRKSYTSASQSYKSMSKANEPFAVVINEGTKEFEKLKLETIVNAIDFKTVGEKIIEGCRTKGADRNRGNLQLNVLFSGGENYIRGQEQLTYDFGCAMPGKNEGTEEWMHLAIVLSDLMRNLGVKWTKSGQLSSEDTERMKKFAWKLHKRNALEGMTLAAMRLFPKPGAVKPHVDSKNCNKFRHVMILSQIVHINGEIWRISLIGYMRKSCCDAMVRREACREVAINTSKYLRTLPKHLKPMLSTDEHVEFYKNLGELGLGLIVSSPSIRDPQQPVRVHSAALFNRPHMDKPMSYLSAVSSAILQIYKKNHHMSEDDIYLMALPVGQLAGIFTYCSVLTILAAEDHVPNCGPLRVLDVIVDRMVLLADSYAGGKYPRTQNSWKGGPPMIERTLNDVAIVRRLCRQSKETPPQGQGYESFCDEMYSKYTGTLSRLYGVGEFGSQSLLAVLVQVGVLKPTGMLHCASFAITTSTLKEDKDSKKCSNPNPAMMRYLYGTGKGGGSKQAQDRAKRVMESVVPHLRLTTAHYTSAIVEQVNCESYRKKAVADFYFPNGKNYYYPFKGCKQNSVLWEMQPEFLGSKAQLKVNCKPRQPPEQRSYIGYGQSYTDGSNTEATQSTGTQVFYCRIPSEEIQEFDGLMEEIRALFIGNTMELTQVHKWIEEHSILRDLIRKFCRITVPMKRSLALLTKTKEIDGEESEDENTAVDDCCDVSELSRPRMQHSNAAEQSKAKATTSDHNAKNKKVSFAASVEYSLIEEDSTRWQDEESAKSTSGSSCSRKRKAHKLSFSHANVQKECLTIESALESVQQKSKSSSSPVTNGNETQDDGAGEARLAQPNLDDFVKPFGSIKLYQFPTSSLTKQVVGVRPEAIVSNRKLLAIKKEKHTLSPIHGELKRCLYFGVSEARMPQDLWKRVVTPVFCNGETHELSSEDKRRLFMAQLVTNKELQVYDAGVCSIVDQIAKNLGAFPARSKILNGVVNWLFPSYTQSKLHLYQCLMVLGGKPAYFKRLFAKLEKKTAKKQGATTGQKFTIIEVQEPEDGVGAIFYYLYNHGKRPPSSSIILSPGKVDPAETERLSLTPVVIDVISWKNATKMQAFDADFTPERTLSKRSQRRLRRRLQRAVHQQITSGASAAASQVQSNAFLCVNQETTATSHVERYFATGSEDSRMEEDAAELFDNQPYFNDFIEDGCL